MMTSRWRRFSILTAFFIKIVITSFSFELSPSSYEPQGRNGVGLLILNATPVGHRHAVGFFESGSHFTRSIGALQSMSSMAGIASYKNTPASSPLKKARCLYALAKEDYAREKAHNDEVKVRCFVTDTFLLQANHCQG